MKVNKRRNDGVKMWRKKNNHSKGTQILLREAPFQVVEAYRALRTNLQFVSVNQSYKKIIVTSAVPGEGKSTVAINMALSLVDLGKKVLLVDCDLRKPMIKKYLHIEHPGGLTNLLANAGNLEQSIQFLKEYGLYVITSGPIPPNPAEMLGSKRMEELIDQLESKFDYIIFDTPPVSVVTDAAVLSTRCDGVILVVKHKATSREVASLAKNNLDNVGANIIGCVLNIFKAEESSKSYAYYRYKTNDYAYKA